MLLAINFVRATIGRLRLRPDTTEELRELEEIEAEARDILARDNSWVSGSTLDKLFFAEIDAAKLHLRNGRIALAQEHHSYAKATLECIRRNILHSTPRASKCVMN